MSWTNLPTNFVDRIWTGLKKYIPFTNQDETVSFQDVTEYGNSNADVTQMSAAQLNQMTGAINQMMTGIAEEFSTSTSYAVGDYCMYNDQLYRFTAAHAAGAWNSNHVTAVSKITNEIRADNTPTANSTKLVRSGGVYSALVQSFRDVYKVTLPSASASKKSFTAAGITANHVMVVEGWAYFSNPNAVTSDLTITTAANSITITGTLTGTTDIIVTLGIPRTITAS